MGGLREEIERQLRSVQQAEDSARRNREQEREEQRTADLDRQEGLRRQAIRATQLLEEVGASQMLQEFNDAAWRARGRVREWICEDKGTAGLTLYFETPDVRWVVDVSAESHYEGSGEGAYLVYSRGEKGHYEVFTKSIELEMAASQTNVSIYTRNTHTGFDAKPSFASTIHIEPVGQLRSRIIGNLADRAILWSKPTPVERQPLFDTIISNSKDRVHKYAGKKQRYI